MLVLAGLTVACFWPSLQSYAADRMRVDATSLFILLSCAGIPGFGCMAWLMGWVGERAGLARSFMLMPPAFLLLAAVLLAERRTRAPPDAVG